MYILIARAISVKTIQKDTLKDTINKPLWNPKTFQVTLKKTRKSEETEKTN